MLGFVDWLCFHSICAPVSDKSCNQLVSAMKQMEENQGNWSVSRQRGTCGKIIRKEKLVQRIFHRFLNVVQAAKLKSSSQSGRLINCKVTEGGWNFS